MGTGVATLLFVIGEAVTGRATEEVFGVSVCLLIRTMLFDVDGLEILGAGILGEEIRGAEILGEEILGAETLGEEIRGAEILLLGRLKEEVGRLLKDELGGRLLLKEEDRLKEEELERKEDEVDPNFPAYAG